MLLGGLQGLSASYGKGSQNSTAKDTANKGSTVFAGRTVSIESGKDTDIIGSHVKAEQVTANVAGNLHIESEQDGKEYHEEGKQIGTSLGYDVGSHQLSGFGSAGKSKTDSHYASVTDKSKSDLYWNPKTGDVHSVPKRGGGEPEWVGNVKY